MTSNKIAIIDMGTNTFHLLIARQIEGKVETILKEKVSVKIGQNGISKGLISPEAYSRAIEALKHFTCLIIEHDVHDVRATATSAVRNAANGKDLVAEIKRQTGIDVLVISGEKEAELIYYGVKAALKIGPQTSIIMDIGGGSVEFIICNDTTIFWKGSFEIGAQRLIDGFQKTDPISQDDTQNLKNYLDEKLYYLFEAARKYVPEVLIGSSGSFDTFCDIDLHSKGITNSIEEEKEYSLSIEAFNKIYDALDKKDRNERMLIPGMIEMRVDMIVVASILTSYIINKLKLRKIRVSTYALKEGVLSKVANGEEI